MNIKHVLLFTVIGAFLSACAAPLDSPMSNKPEKKFEIEFVVVEGGTKLKIVTPDIDCGKNENGCMRVLKPNSGEITFKFKNPQKLPCAHPLTGWYLSKIELANIEGDFGQDVNEWIVKDFGLTSSNGEVWNNGGSKENVSATITDLNKHSGVVYYQITAESCDSSKPPITSDPRVINEGGTNIQ